ncbi:hypothetical protein [Neorhizobium alkalisoli]|uniref:Lipoprotein n=1 Tax=Neorhizobium alkalisoli TaxID=528178 RepID=A0A561QW00_9HYPH|nr:hypothetical protein [Neorhizobium alkalisoli]TWF54554.1 hypothetical protein FHW37_103424 [Neorhizobium alkalisoli]
MRLFGKLLSANLLLIVLTSCNTSDALSPPMEIGSSRRPSTPVTQADTERMARAPLPEASGAANSYPQQSGNIDRGPQNTLDAQADAMQSGNGTSPASSGPPPQWGDQGPATAAQQPAYDPPAHNQQAPQQQAGTPPPAAATTDTVRFLPIIGAPVQAVTPLSRRLGSEARAAGLTIRPSGDTGTEQILKGYFSAFSDEGKVTIVYVWDVLDGSGARLHRMQGQENIAGGGQDPWASVPASVMETIADKTIREYMSWRRSRAG